MCEKQFQKEKLMNTIATLKTFLFQKITNIQQGIFQNCGIGKLIGFRNYFNCKRFSKLIYSIVIQYLERIYVLIKIKSHYNTIKYSICMKTTIPKMKTLQ